MTSPGAQPDSTSTNCSICLDPFNSPAACVPCGHVFCRACISQWYATGGGAHHFCPQCRTFITSIQSVPNLVFAASARARFRLPKVDLVEGVRRLRRGAVSKWRSWCNLQPQIQIFSVIMLVLMASLLVEDLRTAHGLFNICVFPILKLCTNIVRELLCCLLLLVCRPIVCLAQCALEVLYALWDIGAGIRISATTIAYNLILIPIVFILAVFEWMCILSVFFWEIVVSAIRLLFIGCLICIPVYFARMTEAQRTQSFVYCMDVLRHLRDEYRAGVNRFQQEQPQE